MLMSRDTPILRNVLAQANGTDALQSGSSPPHESDNGVVEVNDTNNNENTTDNPSGSNGPGHSGTSGPNNGMSFVATVRKSSDLSYHSSNGSEHSEKVN
jgi:hypothetical protein